MTAAPAATALHAVVLARVGSLAVAVPAVWVEGAQASRERLIQLPRRQGAVAGLLPTPQGCIPVVDLARWVPLPADGGRTDDPPTDGAPCYLTLRQGNRRLAVQVDELLGLQRVPADRVQRLHHRDDPEELFDAVIPGTTPDEAAACLLEPERLMRLLALWCDDVPAEAVHKAGAGRTAANATRLALLRVAGQRLAVEMQHVAELMPMPALKTRLAPGGASAGFADWRGGTLAVLRTGWLQGQTEANEAALALVVCDDSGRAVALPVDDVLGVTALPADTVAADEGQAAWRGSRWTDAEGSVELLVVPALLDALPESALARRNERTAAADTRVRNDEPYFILQAGRTAALPIGDVLAVVETGSLPDHQQTLDWRGRQLPLRGHPTPEGVVVVLQCAGDAVALRVQRLLGLVPAGGAEVSALPGVPGARMLHLPSQAASYAVTRAADLLRA